MNNSLRKLLLKMMNEDQKMCKTEWDIDIHEKHMRKIRQIVKTFGWPGSDLVGEDGAKAAWLIVQHCDEDVKFQKQCLQLMICSVEKKQANPEDVAYLQDRVARNLGNKQVYGTQFYTNSEGKYRPWPIRDIKNIESRRRKAGMQTFKEYNKYMMSKYNGP